MASGYPSHTDIWSRFCAVVQHLPDNPAILRGDLTVSFSELKARATRFAHTLHLKGFMRGERVIVCGENSPEMASAILGILAARLIPTIVNAQAPASHIQHAATRTRACALVTDAEKAAKIDFDGPVFEFDRLGAGDLSDAQTVGTRNPLLGDAASILFTSGSTGLPKGVAQSHANLIWGADSVGHALGLSAQDRLLGAVPWAFDYGWGQLLSTMMLGATHILPEAKGPAELCKAIERHKPTVLPGVPSLFAELFSGMSPIRDTDLTSLRLITNTGSKISNPLFAQINELFPQAQISLNYGLTETYRSATLPFDLARSKSGSVGVALPGAALAVLTEDGQVAKPGEQGEIIHRGSGVFLGYWGDQDKTAEVRRSDPLHAATGLPAPPVVYTGDIGWMDDDGHLFIEGRRDRQIKSMGVRVSPDEIEGLIESTGLVQEVAIFGVPHDIVGQQIIALIVPKGDEKTVTRALRISARETMSPFMQPMVWQVCETLPRNQNGKVDYPRIVTDYIGSRGG